MVEMKFLSTTSILVTLASLVSANRLRGGGDGDGNGEKVKLDQIINELSNKIDHETIKEGLREGLSKSLGFGRLPISSNENTPRFGSLVDGNDGTKSGGGNRKLSSAGYTFTQCPNEVPCDSVIATYTRTEVKDLLDTILSSIINVDGCLDQYSEYYGLCNVDYPCVCPTFENPLACILDSLCLAPVCPADCYANSLEPLIASLVQHGVEVRKICASCNEEITLGNAATDDNGLGYCDSTAYGYNATVSGLLVVPLDETGQNYLPGAMTSNIWSHPTTVETCSIPSQFDVDPDPITPRGDLNALIPLLLGAAGSASLAPDNMGFGSSWDYFKGYITKKQYQTSAMPLWLKARRIVAGDTMCVSEVTNEVVVSGYSEGGYGAVAVAEALESYGANIINLQPGAGPYKLSSTLLLESYKDVVSGVFPSIRRYYMPQLGQGYSSTYGGLENFGLGQDLLADSWTVDNAGVVTTYTKSDAIGITTDLGSESSLNAMVQTPMSIDSLDVWNPFIVEFIGSAVADGDAEPCKNGTRIAEFAASSKPVDKMCEVLVANDLSDYLNSISYPLELCHSPDDEVIPIEVAQNELFSSTLYLVSGDHNVAGQLCIQRAVEFFNKNAYTSVIPERTGIYCPKPTTSPTSSPTNNPSSSPSKSPTSSPSRTPTKSPVKPGVCSNDAQMTCTSDEQCCGPLAASGNIFNRRLKGMQQVTSNNIVNTGRKLAKKTSPPVTPSPTSPPTTQPTKSPIQCACVPVPEVTPSPTSSPQAPVSCFGKNVECSDSSDCCTGLTCKQKGPNNPKKCA